jgi:hypothetical protein
MSTANHSHAYINIKEREIWEKVEIDEKIERLVNI